MSIRKILNMITLKIEKSHREKINIVNHKKIHESKENDKFVHPYIFNLLKR